MFNVGVPEMMVLFLVGLLVFGPDRLPAMMRTVGKAVRSFQLETKKASDVLRAGLEEGSSTLTGVFDLPDGHVTPEPPVTAVVPVEIPEAPSRPAPLPSDHEVNDVVRDYEDT